MKILGDTESKINKNEDDENVPRFKINEVVLMYCNIVSNKFSAKFKSLVHIFS